MEQVQKVSVQGAFISNMSVSSVGMKKDKRSKNKKNSMALV
jgi:hypothetical protein